MPSFDTHGIWTAPPDQRQESPLLRLPAELRFKIWNMCLVPSKILVTSPNRPIALSYFTGGEDWAKWYA